MIDSGDLVNTAPSSPLLVPFSLTASRITAQNSLFAHLQPAQCSAVQDGIYALGKAHMRVYVRVRAGVCVYVRLGVVLLVQMGC